MFILKILWISILFIILAITIYFYDGMENSDIEIFLSYSMFLLTFPSGLILSGLLSGVIYLIVSVFDEGFVGFKVNCYFLFLEWFVLFIIGYAQWFIIIPIFHKSIHKNNVNNQ